jgi:2-oxo-4-hydroxy-4-carboxy--5-ureidoimidazoline (OHCU) decarboxylase
VLLRAVRALREGAETPGVGEAVSLAVPDAEVAAAIAARLASNAYEPAPDRERVREGVTAVVDGLSTGRLVDLLSGFNRFGEDGGARPELSEQEESGIARSETEARGALVRVAAAYERRFGWRAVVAADGLDAGRIAAELAAALDRDAETELPRARKAAADILASRISRLSGA